jgi:hypothetical protein
MAKSGGGWADPALREKQRAATKARWDDPASGPRLRAAIANSENRPKVSAAMSQVAPTSRDWQCQYRLRRRFCRRAPNASGSAPS